MKKKSLALLLVLVMLLSLFVGCAKTEQASSDTTSTTDKSSSTSNDTSASSDTAATSEDHPDSWLCDEKTTLTVFTVDGVSSTYPPPSNDLRFWQWLEEYTNVHIEWDVSPQASYSEVLSTRLSSGSDLADIVYSPDLALMNDAGANGLFLNLADNWSTCFTNTQSYFDNEGTNYTSLITNTDGSIYAIAGTVEPVENHIVLLYNTAWMEKLGASIPKTLDEFNDLLYTMQAAGDINGNGEADEVILTSSSVNGLTSVTGNIFGLEQYEGWEAFVADSNGVVTSEYTSEAQKNHLAWLNGLYEDGILDKEITSMSMDALSEKVLSDRVGIWVFYSSFSIDYGSIMTQFDDPLGEHFTLGYALSSKYNDNTGYFIRRERLAGDCASVSTSCENPELAMRWLDTLLADPEVLQIRVFGFEGEDWEYDANGEVQLIYPEDGSAWNIVKKGCGQIAMPFIQTAGQVTNQYRAAQWYMDQYAEIREAAEWRSPSVARINCYTEDEKAMLDSCKTDVVSYFEEMRDKFIRGDADLDKDWDTYLSTIDKLGLPTMTAAYQSIYDRTN